MKKEDLSHLKAIVIDHRTTIYVNPGVDEAKVRQKYESRRMDSKFEYLETYEKLGNKPLIRLRRSH